MQKTGQIKANAFPYFTRFIRSFKIKVHARSFIMFVPWALKLGWGSPQDFTANSFAKELWVYFILPNSCFTASWDGREERARMGERIPIPRGTDLGKQEWEGETEGDRHRQRKLRLSPLMTVVRREEEESGRNKTINMNSTLGNVCFLDNSELAKQTGPFMTMQNK